jgi:hypothetical protein
LEWCDQIPETERRTVDAYAKWLKPISWQFVTLMFPWNVRAETADHKFKERINVLEHGLKDSTQLVESLWRQLVLF